LRRLVLLISLLASEGVWADPAEPLDWLRLQPVTIPVGGTLTLRGALRSSYDGSVIDAAATRFGDGRLEAGGWLDFGAGGLRLTTQDGDQHRYELAPNGQTGWACLQAQLPSPCLVPRIFSLAQARLLTVADFSATLSGELWMDGSSATTSWQVPWALVLPVGGGVTYLLSRRIRARRQTALYRQARQMIRSLHRRLHQGDPVHQRLLPSLDALAADSKRLESERRRGLAQGWPGEAARAESSLQTVVTSLRSLHRILDSATRLDRARLDPGLLIELDQGIAAAAAAARELEGRSAENPALLNRSP
jgi:hypothetical protein